MSRFDEASAIVTERFGRDTLISVATVNGGGTTKTIFGKEFTNVCRTTFRFDNPTAEAKECVKKTCGDTENLY